MLVSSAQTNFYRKELRGFWLSGIILTMLKLMARVNSTQDGTKLSLRNLLVTSEAVARAARMREESRGAHSRIDFEGERDEWLQYNIILKKSSSGTMSAEKILRDKPDPELERIAKLSIEELEAEVIHDKLQD